MLGNVVNLIGQKEADMALPVDEAGLSHIEITNNNHLGEFEPRRNLSVSHLSMASTVSSAHTTPSFPEFSAVNHPSILNSAWATLLSPSVPPP